MEQVWMVFNLLLATGLGAVVGWQREALDRPAGLRTHMLVSLSAALMTGLGTFVANTTGLDPTRIAAGVVTGIGFLGAGTIMRQGSAVRGLTTAASVFAVAGIGLACGLGFYAGAIVGTALVFGILSYGKKVETHFIPHESRKQLALRASNESNLMGKIEEVLRREKVSIRGLQSEEDEAGQEVVYILELRLPPSADPTQILHEVSKVEAISEIAWRD